MIFLPGQKYCLARRPREVGKIMRTRMMLSLTVCATISHKSSPSPPATNHSFNQPCFPFILSTSSAAEPVHHTLPLPASSSARMLTFFLRLVGDAERILSRDSRMTEDSVSAEAVSTSKPSPRGLLPLEDQAGWDEKTIDSERLGGGDSDIPRLAARPVT
jgi:hypothetical protein